jgi:16S rRNA (uracil1498-N3)-methyltransferase
MKKFFARKQDNKFIFEGDEFAHFNVLRCKVGENVLCYHEDYDYLCEIESVNKKMAVANIISKTENTKNPKVNITIFQGLVKGEKADLIVQKLTELGISRLQFFESDFTIAKANNNKLERLCKISAEACKQCGRSRLLQIEDSIAFKDMLNELKNFDVVFFANEKQTDRTFAAYPSETGSLCQWRCR